MGLGNCNFKVGVRARATARVGVRVMPQFSLVKGTLVHNLRIRVRVRVMARAKARVVVIARLVARVRVSDM